VIVRSVGGGVLATFMLMGCAAPDKMTPQQTKGVLGEWAAQTQSLDRVHLDGQVQFEWRDDDGDHMEQGDLGLWLDGDTRSSIRVTKFGDVYLWAGADSSHVWVFDFLSEPSVLRVAADSKSLGVDALAARPAVLRMLLGLDSFPSHSTVTHEHKYVVVTAKTLGGQLEARLSRDPLRPVQIAIDFPDQPRVVAQHRWTTGEVRIDGLPTARRLSRVVDVHDDTTIVKIRTSYAQALTATQMNDMATVFDVEKIKAHLKPEVVE
jgi:hypothetical protein